MLGERVVHIRFQNSFVFAPKIYRCLYCYTGVCITQNTMLRKKMESRGNKIYREKEKLHTRRVTHQLSDSSLPVVGE